MSVCLHFSSFFDFVVGSRYFEPSDLRTYFPCLLRQNKAVFFFFVSVIKCFYDVGRLVLRPTPMEGVGVLSGFSFPWVVDFLG